MSKKVHFLLLLLPLIIFFYPIYFKGKMPIPADTIVGMYHPFRDEVWKGFTAGVPFKNFLITDAVRQQYPWRKLAFDLIKRGISPGWNPYTHAGTPLAANIQTSLWYPLNILNFIFPFNVAWSIQVILQLFLLAIFMYVYLREIGRSKEASVLAALSLSLCGFSIAWLEWNTTLHTLVWLPLSLLAIEKIIKQSNIRWYIVLIFSLISIFFAGFLQTSFYSYFIVASYVLFRLFKRKNNNNSRRKLILNFVLCLLIILVITSIQWLPTVRLITYSARNYDQGNVLEHEDWFLPWQNLIQFTAPDFFGNPSTLNYWGIFNYTEFIGYIGIAPLIFAVIGLLTKDKSSLETSRFFKITFLASLIFATPNPLAKLPFQLNLPFISTAQPSRIMMLIDFSLAVLTAFGFDWYLKKIKYQYQKKYFWKIISVILLFTTLILLWLTTTVFTTVWNVTEIELKVAQRNLIFPTIIGLITSATLIILSTLIQKKSSKRDVLLNLLFIFIYIITSLDLLRFAIKFTPFSDPDFLYPTTKTLEFMRADRSIWRYMTTDRRILPPNFSIPYKLQTIEGYDPIYLKNYGQLIASAQKGFPTQEPIPFHRIISPENYESMIFDLLNVKYILALKDLSHPKLKLVFQEGETRVYENINVFPRVFILKKFNFQSDDEALAEAFQLTKEDIDQTAQIIEYKENQVKVNVEDELGGMLILSDVYYPGWEVTIDGKPGKIQPIFYALRGTIIPPGQHEVIYSYSQL